LEIKDNNVILDIIKYSKVISIETYKLYYDNNIPNCIIINKDDKFASYFFIDDINSTRYLIKIFECGIYDDVKITTNGLRIFNIDKISDNIKTKLKNTFIIDEKDDYFFISYEKQKKYQRFLKLERLLNLSNNSF